jgi:hypothetical protein
VTKQLMIYESAVPVSAARHADACLEPGTGYAFAAHTSAVPLMAVEFLVAATEYAIVFAPVGDTVVPAAVLGLQTEQNLFVGQDDKWKAKYVPAFIRRYPFVFSASADQKTLVLCIDESSPGFNRAGKGQALFDAEKKPTAYTQRVLKFLQDYQVHFRRTQLFCQHLKELDVLEPTTVRVSGPASERHALGGFQVVNRKKLREVPADKVAALLKTDELELIYLHLYSMRNFVDMKDRLIGSLPAEGGDTAAGA